MTMDMPRPTALPAEPDWKAVTEETVAHLQAMIRMNTVNPPGNELVVARYLQQVLSAEGIETRLFEPAPGRAAVVARLRGSGARRPVLLMAHMDVVGVEQDSWSVDPFGGVVKDGYVYGRGAIDDKGMLAANFVTMLLLKRNVLDRGGVLSRDVVFVANSDEEAGGDWGMGWLLANHPELLEAEFAVNEGGRTRVVRGKPLYLAIQNTEKVSHVVEMRVSGSGGHASVPLPDNPLWRLGRALAAIGAHREPLDVRPTTREFFAQLSRVWPDATERQAMADVVATEPARQTRGAEVLAGIPVFDALLRNGVSAAIVSGGIRSNVIPTDATATLNVRTLPGAALEDVISRLRVAVDDGQVEFRVVEESEDAPASDFHSAMFRAIADATHAADPELTVVPYMSTGATDSARLRMLGIQAFGILPFPMDQNDEDRMHGHDERVPIASLGFGVRVIYGAIVRVAR